MRSQSGSTLIQVLLVILVFSILGISLLSGVVGENKRVHKTDEHIQERNMARDGLTYFEADFKQYVIEHAADGIILKDFLDLYEDGKEIPITNGMEAVTINLTARLHTPDKLIVRSGEKVDLTNKYTIEVKSQPEGVEKPLYGYYRLDISTPIKLVTFNGDAEKIDFSEKLLNLNLLGLISVDLLPLQGNHEDYYPVPNDKILSGGLAELDLLGLLGLWDTFHTMETKEVIAVKNVSLLEANVVDGLLHLEAINLGAEDSVNVLINGSYTELELLGFPLKEYKLSIGGYKNIHFKKLAVTGNALIEQDSGDSDGSRTFAFADGLFVKKSLNIGGLPEEASERDSHLVLDGDMAVMENLYITNTNFESDGSNLYVHGDAEIKQSCINPIDTNKDFRLFVQENLTINHYSDCNNLNGLLFAGEGIHIDTDPEGLNVDKDMTIHGGVIGTISVTGGGKVTIFPDPGYLEKVQISNAKLIPLGRTYE